MLSVPYTLPESSPDAGTCIELRELTVKELLDLQHFVQTFIMKDLFVMIADLTVGQREEVLGVMTPKVQFYDILSNDATLFIFSKPVLFAKMMFLRTHYKTLAFWEKTVEALSNEELDTVLLSLVALARTHSTNDPEKDKAEAKGLLGILSQLRKNSVADMSILLNLTINEINDLFSKSTETTIQFKTLDEYLEWKMTNGTTPSLFPE